MKWTLIIFCFSALANAQSLSGKFLFQAFDSADRYRKLPTKLEQPLLIIFIPSECRRCWSQHPKIFAALGNFERKLDVWFVSDFATWADGRDLFANGRWPAKVSNHAFHDPGGRFATARNLGSKTPTVIYLEQNKVLTQAVRGEGDWRDAFKRVGVIR